MQRASTSWWSGFARAAPLRVALVRAAHRASAQLETIPRKELAARLTLNSLNSYIEPQKLSNVPMTILTVFDECAVSAQVRDDMFKLYPHAKPAHLKTGGNFPYLSRSDEVSMHLIVHLRDNAKDAIQMRPDGAGSADATAASSDDRGRTMAARQKSSGDVRRSGATAVAPGPGIMHPVLPSSAAASRASDPAPTLPSTGSSP